MIVALLDKLFVRRDPKSESEGKIFIPDRWRKATTSGVVESAGPMVGSVKAGQRIMFREYAAAPIDGDLFVVPESAVLGVIDAD